MSRFPGAVWRPVWWADKQPQFSSGRPLGWIVHVPVSGGSLFGYFDGLQPPNRKVSTGWVGKDGAVEQYIDGNRTPWAQVSGNSDYQAWEFEGYPTEPMTRAQLETAARIHIWSGAIDRLANRPGERGIGTHSMGGAAWGGHECPGPIRTAQRGLILQLVADLRHPAPSPPPPPVTEGADTMPVLIPVLNETTVYAIDAAGKRHIGPYEAGALRAAGAKTSPPLTRAAINEIPDVLTVPAIAAAVKAALAVSPPPAITPAP